MTRAVDTICALASPAGRGGVSIVRVSGPLAADICNQFAGFIPVPGQARVATFRDSLQQPIDFGLLLFFAAPASFTGEDVAEFQVHGSPVVVDLLLGCLLKSGCRLARPGEFSERAFLNDKLDLVQAEAIADLIESASTTAARMALRSMHGDFSRLVNALIDDTTKLRIHVEAAIDFPEDDVDFLQDKVISTRLASLQSRMENLLEQVRQGSLVREGIRVVLAGAPNTGKSTLLNALSGSDTAIVTDIPGTTRDILRHELLVEGMPVHVADTAGLRRSDDPVELEGIRRARSAMSEADRILMLVDARTVDSLPQDEVWQQLTSDPALTGKLTLVVNKIDLAGQQPALGQVAGMPAILLSAKLGLGLDLLKQHLARCAGRVVTEEGGFIARRRHLDALLRAQDSLGNAEHQLVANRAGELMAEELRRAHDALGEITGKITADDLLGMIFSSFCIGK